nr:hypothetical protein [Tanacetum cinerariifolium]
MANLTFPDTHNMVALLSKSDASEGFDQIVDFLNGQVIQYVLMVNPTIYVSCIKQFWATVSIKKVNDVVKLRALIDGKQVVVTEDVIRHDLRLDDADGVKCLPNEEIFTELARMGYEKPPPKLTFYKAFFFAQWKFLIHTLVQCISAKRTAWNKFSCSMSSVVICLATSRKLNFSKYIFDSMVRNVDMPGKFLIIGKGFSRVETPLFGTMLVQPQAEVEEDEVEKRVKKLEQQRRSKSSGLKRLRKVGTSQRIESSAETVMGAQEDACRHEGRIEAIDANEEITLVDMETQADLGVELQGRKDDDNAAIKKASAAEPTMFDDEEVTMTMAQTLIKMKAKKARLLDEKMAKRLHDEEVEHVAAREKQEKDDLEKAKVLQKYSSQKEHDSIYEEYGWVQDGTLYMTYDKESFKKLKAVEVSSSHSTQDAPTIDPKKMSEEDVKNMLEIVPVSEFKVEALQVKYPFIDWEIHSEGSRSYWEIIRVGGITQAYQSFEDMLKDFDREDLDALWRLVKEKFSTAVPTVENEKALWVELKRLFEPNAADVFWKLQKYMHDQLTWKLYTNCGVHQVSSTRRHDIFMLTEKDYPLSDVVMIFMLSAKLQVDEDCEMARDLVMKIFMKANQLKSRSLDTSSK